MMAGCGRLSNSASQERYRAKNRERLAIKCKLNYHKRKMQKAENELKEFEEKEKLKE